jgi:hypothetical protein
MKLRVAPPVIITSLLLTMSPGVPAWISSVEARTHAQAPADGADADAQAAPGEAHAGARGRAKLALPVSGTFTDRGGKGKFTGKLHLQRFAARNGRVVAVGKVSGTLTNSAGEPVGTVLRGPVEIPVNISHSELETGTTEPDTDTTEDGCQEQVLHLEIEGLTLDLLGLHVVSGAPVVLDVSASSDGALGALVCEVIETVDNLTRVVSLLNQVLGALGSPTA